MRRLFFIIFLLVNVNLLFSQYKNFNTCDFGDNEWIFYKNYVIREGDIHINGVPINPFYSYTFFGPEVPFGAGGIDYDYNRDMDCLIIKETKDEYIKEFISKEDKTYKIRVRYYNNNKNYILNKFNKNFIYCLQMLIGYLNKNGMDNALCVYIVNNMDKEDLAIFRNFLFALNNYKFQNKKWTDYFTEYYVDYKGTLNNEECLNKFTKIEKEILEIIIKKENS